MGIKEIIKNFPGLVKPYTANPDIDWTTADMSTTTMGMRFADEGVQGEFVVFLHRDLIMIVVSSMYVWACGSYSPVGLVILNGFEWINYGSALMLSGCLLADLYLYAVADLTAKVCRTRRGIHFIMAIPIAACCCMTPFPAYQIENCKSAFDLADGLGLRATPAFTPEEFSWYCSATVEPFSIVAVTVGFFGLPFPPFIMVPLLVMALTMLTSMRALYPGHDYEPPAELATKSVLTILVCVLIAVVNGVRYAYFQHQFKLAIQVKKETLLSEKQEEDVDTLLCSMLPGTALERLGRGQHVADYTDEATVLFSDMVGFTSWSSSRTPEAVVSMLNAVCRDIDKICFDSDIEKIKTIGDAYWAVSGLPGECENHAEKICDFGNEMLNVVAKQNKKHPQWNNVQLRIGVHSGPLNGGILGTQQLSYEVWGDTSALANKAEQFGVPNRVCATRTALEFMGLEPEALGQPSSTIPASTEEGEKETIDLFALKRTTVQNMIAERNAGVIAAADKHEEGLPISTTRRQSGGRRHSGASLLGVKVGGRRSSITSSGHQPSIRSGKSGRSGRSGRSGLVARTMSTLSSHSAYSKADLTITAEEAKKNRSKLLQQRAAARNELGIEEEPEEDMDALVSRYSKRKWSWVLEDYADEEVEAEYFQFVRHRQLTLRTVSRVATLCILGGVIVGVVIQGGTFSSFSSLCFVMAALVGTVDLICCLLQAKPAEPGSAQYLKQERQKKPVADQSFFDRLVIQRWKGQTVLMHLTCILIFIGAGSMEGGQSAGTNDITYLHAPLTCIIGVGNIGLVSSAALLITNLFLLVPLMLAMIMKVVFYGTHQLFLTQANLCVAFTIIILEKQYRNAFLQHHVAVYMQARQVQRGKEREALLASMVPAHIVQELMVWMITMDPTKSIVQKLPMVAVGFIQTYAPSDKEITSQGLLDVYDLRRASGLMDTVVEGAAEGGGMGMMGMVARARTNPSSLLLPGSAPSLLLDSSYGRDGEATNAAPSPNFVSSPIASPKETPQQEEVGNVDPVPQSRSTRVDIPDSPRTAEEKEEDATDSSGAEGGGDDDGSVEDNAGEYSSGGAAPISLREEHWLQVIHNQVDELLKSFVAVSKIKSIGDYVMLAGPFDVDGRPQGDIAEACDDMLAAAHLINAVAPCRAGIHVGELVGAVLGTNRLCYDIFGDTVNTASRTMSSGEKGDLTVTEEFFLAHPVQCHSMEGQSHDDTGDDLAKLCSSCSAVVTDDQSTICESCKLSEKPPVITVLEPNAEASPTGFSLTIPEATKEAGPQEIVVQQAALKRKYSTIVGPRIKRNADREWLTSEATFSDEPRGVYAKGKGTILVRTVVSVPPVDVGK